MKTESIFWSNFTYLCMQAGKAVNTVAAEIGIASGTMTSWKGGKQPSERLLFKIANYFNVSPENLVSINLNLADAFTPDELALIVSYRKLNQQGKEQALSRVNELTEITRYTEDTSLEGVS